MIKPDKASCSSESPGKRVLLACEDIALAKHYAAILGDAFTLAFSTNPEQAHNLHGSDQPDVVLIDPAFNQGNITAFVGELARNRPETSIIVIASEEIAEDTQAQLLKAGVHGFCKRDTTPALLMKAIQLVSEGEFWLQRKLLTQLIGELAREVKSAASGSPDKNNEALKGLTPRELEVAEMVHLGNNNKTIARLMGISERTVKAHLSAIFRKLGIDNRLQLALFFNKMT